MNFKKLCLFTVVLFCSKIACANLAKTELTNFKNQYLKTHTLNAIYAVYQGSNPLLEGASGFRFKKLEGDTSNKQDQLLSFEEQMPVASGTKQITAAAILRLLDQGKLTLKDTISKHIPHDSKYWGGNMPSWAKEINIHQLLIHSSGIQEYIPSLKIDLSKPHKVINAEILQFAAKSPLLFTPGKKFEYCNTGYVILGVIIENVSGSELAKFFQEEFFTPLDMKETYLSNLEEAIEYQNGVPSDKYPTRYFIIPGNVPPMFAPVPNDIKLSPFADGGVVSSARDMTKWMMSLHNGKVLSEKSLKLMTTPHILAKNKAWDNAFYGYGIYILNENGKTLYSHGGNAIAIRGEYSYIKEINTSVIVLSNTMVHAPEPLEGKIDYSQDHNQLDIIFFNKGLISLLCK